MKKQINVRVYCIRLILTVTLGLVLALTISCGDSLDDLLDLSSSSTTSSSAMSSSSSLSSSSLIVIEDDNIGPAASFASRVFYNLLFPFYAEEDGSFTWFTMNEYYGDLDLIIANNDNDGDGDAFGSIFNLLYSKREEYLINGKFKRYIELLANFISHQTYVSSGWDDMVKQLLTAYNDLKAKPNGFRNVYDIMDANCPADVNSVYCPNATEVYDQIFDFVSNKQLEDFILKHDLGSYYDYWPSTAGNVNKSAVVWAYSFWGRRYNENPDIIEPIVSILQLLHNNYPK